MTEKNKVVAEISEQLKNFSPREAEIILLKVLIAVKEQSEKIIRRQAF